MADAKALFKRHLSTFQKSVFPDLSETYFATGGEKAILYAACIIAEAIRNDQDDLQMKVIQPEDRIGEVHVDQ